MPSNTLTLDAAPAGSGRMIWATLRTSSFTDSTAALLTVAGTTSVSLKVYDSDGLQVGATQTLTVSNVILDVPVTVFGKSRNFRYEIPASLLPDAQPNGYTCVFTVTPNSGQPIVFVVIAPTYKTW